MTAILINTLLGNRITNKLDALVNAYARQSRFSGAVLVAKDDHVILKKGYGLANLEYDIAVKPHSAFRIGSMTKPFTALAIMQQVEAGKLSLSDSIHHFLPVFPNGDRITIQHLLSNTSGIEDFISMPEYAHHMRRSLTLDELTAYFDWLPLRFEPGTEYGYSNSNWILLGIILEQLTGQPYAEAIYERIFEPAGMTASGYHWSDDLIRDRAQGYIDTGKAVLNAEVVHEDSMHAAGALYSTVEDLYRWDQALYQETLVSAQTLAQMIQPITTESSGAYGLGWELHTIHGHRCIGHSGGLPGFTSNIARFIEDRVTIIILSNLGSSAWEKLNDSLAAIVFHQPYSLPTDRVTITVDPSVLANYAGTFEITFFGRTALLTFKVEDGLLTMSTPGLPKAVTSALGNDKFYARSKGEVEFTFIGDEAGKFDHIKALWSGHPCQGHRVS